MSGFAQLRQFLRQSGLARAGFSRRRYCCWRALLAPWIVPADPAAQDLPIRLSAPSRAHWMGTDELGRDILLTRTIYGARDFADGGDFCGLRMRTRGIDDRNAGGLYRGMVRPFCKSSADQCVSVVPRNTAGDCVRGISRAGHRQSDHGAGDHRMGRICATGTRASFKAKELEFMLAARSLGASHVRILVRHMFPNILQPILIQATIGMAGAILAESTLSFLGLGVLAPTPAGVRCSTMRAAICSTRLIWWFSLRWR